MAPALLACAVAVLLPVAAIAVAPGLRAGAAAHGALVLAANGSNGTVASPANHFVALPANRSVALPANGTVAAPVNATAATNHTALAKANGTAPAKSTVLANASAAIALTSEGHQALKALLADLAAEGAFGVARARFVPPSNALTEGKMAFLPKCGEHVTKLVKMIDASYTDTHLEHMLLQECTLEEEQPGQVDTAFNSGEACRDFAGRLAAARMEELKSGSQAGYAAFCEDYYAHSHPTQEPPPTTTVKGAAAGAKVGCSLLCVLLALAL